MSCRSPWRLSAQLHHQRLLTSRVALVPSLTTATAAARWAHDSARDRRPLSRREQTHLARSDLVNPPATTRPPHLAIPHRDAYDSQLQYLFELGKGYIRFYKDGVKSVWANRELVKAKLARTPAADRPSMWKPHFVPDTFSRADWVLLWRTRHDMVRLPLFGLMLVVIGEMTVFVVAFVEGLVPYPCRIPSQTFNSQRRAETRRRLCFDQLEREYPLGPFDPAMTPRAARMHVLRSLYMSGDIWEYLPRGPLALPPGMWAAKGRLRLAFLEGDDRNLVRDGGVAALNPEELRLACADRGIDYLSRGDTELRGWLADWLRLTAAQDPLEQRRRITVLLLTRPEQWPETRDFPVPEWVL